MPAAAFPAAAYRWKNGMDRTPVEKPPSYIVTSEAEASIGNRLDTCEREGRMSATCPSPPPSTAAFRPLCENFAEQWVILVFINVVHTNVPETKNANC